MLRPPRLPGAHGWSRRPDRPRPCCAYPTPPCPNAPVRLTCPAFNGIDVARRRRIAENPPADRRNASRTLPDSPLKKTWHEHPARVLMAWKAMAPARPAWRCATASLPVFSWPGRPWHQPVLPGGARLLHCPCFHGLEGHGSPARRPFFNGVQRNASTCGAEVFRTPGATALPRTVIPRSAATRNLATNRHSEERSDGPHDHERRACHALTGLTRITASSLARSSSFRTSIVPVSSLTALLSPVWTKPRSASALSVASDKSRRKIITSTL